MPTYAENLIGSVTVGAGGSSSIDFTSIPSTYTDLKVVFSGRATISETAVSLQFNGDTSTSNYSYRTLKGSGSAASSSSETSLGFIASRIDPSTYTANTFSNNEFYIPNYAGSTQKSVSVDGLNENSATAADSMLTAGLWSSTAAITSIKLYVVSGNLAQYSTAYLYGITNATNQSTSKAIGGVVTSDSTYYYHTFTSVGTFTPLQSLTADILVVAGGGGPSNGLSGGGGAGGLVYLSSQSLTAQAYPVIVGAGGPGGGVRINTAMIGSNGSNSQFGALTAAVGGGKNGTSGGSGGGADENNASAGTGTSGQGNAGGARYNNNYATGGGGGGAGAAGGNGADFNSGAGGNGLSTYSSWGAATGTGQNVSGTYYYAGGGSGGGLRQYGSQANIGAAGYGGGGTGESGGQGTASSGLVNTGGGGGGGGTYSSGNTYRGGGGNGGSGIVIVRYAK